MREFRWALRNHRRATLARRRREWPDGPDRDCARRRLARCGPPRPVGAPGAFGQGVPEPGGERQLTDIIEGGLASAGAAPLRTGDTGPQSGGLIERPPIRLLDVLA